MSPKYKYLPLSGGMGNRLFISLLDWPDQPWMVPLVLGIRPAALGSGSTA